MHEFKTKQIAEISVLWKNKPFWFDGIEFEGLRDGKILDDTQGDLLIKGESDIKRKKAGDKRINIYKCN